MQPPNVLLILLDSVRAKNTSLHNHINETTPYLQEFSNHATKYEFGYAPGIHSIASHVSIFTGYHVEEHQATSHNSRIDPTETIWWNLKDTHEYTTGFFTPNAVITRSSNLSDCFDYVVGPRRRGSVPFPDALSPSDLKNLNKVGYTGYAKKALTERTPVRSFANGATELVNKIYNERFLDESCTQYFSEFLSWADDQEGPWASCVNVMDAHYPYEPKSEFDKWGGEDLQKIHKETIGPYSNTFLAGEKWWKLRAFEGLYDGAIYQADQGIKQLISNLKDRGLYDDTLIVITSDHGEGFGERSALEPSVRLVDHSWGIDEELVHVPLIVKYPNQKKGRTVDAPATLTRFPTVVDRVVSGDWSKSAFIPSRDVISSTYRYKNPSETLPNECENTDRYQGPWRAVYRDTGEYITKIATRGPTAARYYILDAQTCSKISDNGKDELMTTFETLVNKHADVRRSNEDISADVQQHLEELGYIT